MTPQADVLTSVLERTGLRGRVYCRSVAHAPWGLAFEPANGAIFHLVVSGSAWLLHGRRRVKLDAGDVVLVAQGRPHALADDPGSPTRSLASWLSEHDGRRPMRLGREGGRTTEVLCGVYEFALPAARHPVLSLLPEWLHVPSQAGHAPPELTATVASLAAESERGPRGSAMILSRLLDVLFVQLVRAWVERESPERTGWIGALEDPVLAQALAAIHAEPARAWDVPTLAKTCGASRATLARRFADRIGQPPATYLTRVRMEEAARRLSTRDDGLAEIAAAVGYESEFAFSRAFRKVLGVAPGRYRERMRAAGSPLA